MDAGSHGDTADQRSDWVLLLHDLMVLTDRAGSMGQALQATVDRISRELSWPVGHFFVPRGDGVLEFGGGVWKLASVGGEGLILGSQGARYRPGESWIGRAAQRRSPIWIADLAAASDRLDDARLRPALDLGLNGLAVQPVTLGGEVLAVLEFFTRHTLPPSPRLRDLLAQAAGHLGRLAARLRVEEHLRRSREELAAGRQARQEFLTDLNHRIRTPMNAVIGLTELLLRTDLTAQQRDFATTVRASGGEVMEIIEDALEFLGIESDATPESRDAPAPRPDAATVTREGPLRVLVVEDNLINQMVAVKILEVLEHRAEAVGSGAEALQALEERTFDVVLMDVEMPGLDGLETTRRLRRRSSGPRPRIIAMTARAMPGDREDCLAAGMDDYVSKPVTIASVRGALERSRGPA